MSSPEKEEGVSSSADACNGASGSRGEVDSSSARPAKRPHTGVIEISDTESDDSDICAVTSYQASAEEVKRIRKASYSSSSSGSSSSSDYSSDSESSFEDDSIVIEDDPSISSKSCKQGQLNPRANRMDDPVFNPKIKAEDLTEKLTAQWSEKKDHQTQEVTLTSDPFRLCLIHDFLQNPEIINNMVDDMNTLDWSRKKMDLYEFHQTADLASLTWQRSIRGIYELLKTEVMSWVSKVTGLQLTHISASCSLYGPGDHLLVHDDMMSDRRVAFIMYLAPWTPRAKAAVANGNGEHQVVEVEESTGWRRDMGGALQLLTKDQEGRARTVHHAVYPSNNMLAFFQVGPDSFHQVEEVVSLELPRLSINGWFHGPGPEPETPPAPLPLERHKPHNEVVLMNSWIDASYMTPRARSQVQSQMERDSEVSMHSVLQQDKVQELLAALAHPDTVWEPYGPADRVHCSRLVTSDLPKDHAVALLLQLATSHVFARMLVDCTDLQITGYSGLQLTRWKAGDYALLPHKELYQESRLEMTLHLGVPAHPICGGSTAYVSPEDAGSTSALLTVPPVDNALSLVYCDVGAAPFVKYLSKMTMKEDECFYMLTCTFWE